jgi:hypothetical protein
VGVAEPDDVEAEVDAEVDPDVDPEVDPEDACVVLAPPVPVELPLDPHAPTPPTAPNATAAVKNAMLVDLMSASLSR